jgi:WD40 repeat protein
LPRLFISHSSQNDDWALALRDWLVREGWSGKDDIFLDLDPDRGISAGQRWVHALEDAATRCEAVLFIVSQEWLASKWCADEYQLANKLNKKLFALLIDHSPLDRLPGGLTAQWQVVRLAGDPAERFLTVHPLTEVQSPVHIAEAGLASLKRGLEKAGIGPETFELQKEPDGPFGWRAPYRGLEALESEDAAVFFGRNADIVRGIDALRGLAARKPPRLLVILGASGAGKSSFLRAGLWPRLLRDDGQWLPLRAIRAGRGGAIEGSDGLLAALEDLHRRFELRVSRADLRRRLEVPEQFLELLRGLRQAAAKRALLSEPPLAVLCLDQAEEVFAADAGLESEKFLRLSRAAMEADELLLLVTIRSDAYGLMQSAKALARIDQLSLSLGPVPDGEIAHLIREPAEILRRKVGPSAPVFDAAVVERLQSEVAGETDALPLLAFVLQRLMREHAGTATIGVAELEQTGGVAAAIESAAEAALADAGYGADRAQQREVLRRLFIPRLARINRDSKVSQRRVARQDDLPADLLPLARALIQRRLLVAKLAALEGESTGAETTTLEVAHEALLRRWPTLAELLAEDRDALLLLDGVLIAAIDWNQADAALKPDFLVHRGSRLSDALALAARGPDWARETAFAQGYLAACRARETAEREEKEAALAREQARLAEIAAAQARTARVQRWARWALAAVAVLIIAAIALVSWQYMTNLGLQASIEAREQTNRALQSSLGARQQQLDDAQVTLFTELATFEQVRGNLDGALRLGVHAARFALRLDKNAGAVSRSRDALASAIWQTDWRLIVSGHGDAVYGATFSPDGLRILTAQGDKTARIWDAVTGKEIAVLRGHADRVLSATFSADGSRVLTASEDGTVRIWDAVTGEEIAVLAGHAAHVRPSAAFSPDGSRIITASDEGVRIWDAASRKEISVLPGRVPIAFSPDGSRIVISFAFEAHIFDSATVKEIAVLRGHSGYLYSVAFSPDGLRIVTAWTDKTARIWDATTGKEIVVLRGHEQEVTSAAFSPDGSRIVTASADRTVRIWDATTAKEIAIRRGHEGTVNSAAFSPDGARIVTASADKTVRVWDAAPTKPIAVLRGHEQNLWFPSFSPDGSRIVAASEDKTARIWDADTGNEIGVLRGHQDHVNSTSFSPDGTRIVTASDDKTACIWDAVTAKEIAILRGHEGAVNSAVFSPDGLRVLTASADKTARIWDAATANAIAVLRGLEDDGLAQHRISGISMAAFSHDASHLLTVSGQAARIWDAGTGKEIAVLRGREHDVGSAAFSPDGTRVITALTDKTARIWDARTGKEIASLRGHEDSVQSGAFSPDGSRVVTASWDRTARIWNAETGKEIAVLHGHKDSLTSAAFSPDGSRIVTASLDKTARVWDAHFATMSTKGLIDHVCTRALPGLTKLTREEMRLSGYPDDAPEIDVCAGTE